MQLDQHGEIDPVTGYIVEEEFKTKIIGAWKPLVKSMTRKTKFSFFRELHQGFRYMVAHCFLNIFNREVRDGKIVIEEEDVKVAIKLMTRELEVKFEVLSCSQVVSEEKMKTTKDLSAYVDKVKAKTKRNIKETSSNIMGSLLKQ